ncbi:MAG: hypothetical protein R3F61_15420 [Myxococcota bacterium]
MSLLLDAWVLVRDLSWSAEIVTGLSGTTTALGAGAGTHWWQARKSRVLPTLPSHSEALERAPDDGTRFFAAVHELTMCVTEAWNAGRARQAGGRVEALIKRDVLERCRDQITAAETGLRALLSPYAACGTGAHDVKNVLDPAWTYQSRDNYRTETYTVTSTDSKGRTKTETRTRQVYESTDHWFTFVRSTAEVGEQRLEAWTRRFADTRFPMLHIHRHRVDIDKLGSAERSFLERLIRSTVLEDPEAEVSASDLDHWANQWLLGTRVDERLETFQSRRAWVAQNARSSFETIYASESGYHYRTTSRSHSGPPGYQAHLALVRTLGAASSAWNDVDSMLATCVESADTLVAYARDPDVIESDRDYAQIAIRAYEAAFPASEIEVDQLARHGWTVAAALGTGTLVALASYALHPMGLGLW